MRPILHFCILLYVLVGTAPQVWAQAKLYWADTNVIWRGNANGTNPERVLTGIDSLTALAIDPIPKHLYWSTQRQVWRANLDGGNPELIFEGAQITDMAIDTAKKKIYLTSPMLRLDIESGQVDTLSSHVFKRLTFEPETQRLYGISEKSLQYISINNTINNAVSTIINNFSLQDLSFAPQSKKVYWIDIVGNAIRRVNRDGRQVETILNDGLVNIRGFAIDESNQKIYWTSKSVPRSEVSTLYVANMDGSNIREVISVSSKGGWIQDMAFYFPTLPSQLLGDVNGDGQIDSRDAILVLRSIVKLENLNKAQLTSADVTGDGTIDSRDATLILQRIINLVERFPLETR
jgi:hypothetical protein